VSAGHLVDVEVEKTYKLTTFDSVKTTQGDLIELTFDGIVDLIKNGPVKRTKGALPLLQGVERPGNSREAGTAVGDVHVIIVDYDAGQVSIDEAARLLQAEGVQAILATTASHMQKGKDKGKSLGHRLRVLLPLKKPVPATEYADLAEAANAALGGVLAPESAEPSRIFHYGRVEGVPFEVRVVAEGNFLGERLVTDRKTGLLRCFTDDDYFHIGRLLEDGPATFASIPTELLRSAVSAVGSEDVIDSAQEWVGRLQWDRVERINKFFVDYFSAEDTPYVQAVGAYTWTALAGRIVEPGCQADMAPVLQGIQGVRKTSAVRALAPDPEMFVELDLTEDDTELARLMRGKLVGEIAELRGLRGRDSGAIKAWVSRRTEQWTPKYKEFSTSYQRRLILFGTTNEEQFLDDPTGNRRWLPMKVGSVDVDAIERDRDQLWAEGLERFRMNGVEWKAAEELAKLEHAEFTITDPWAETAADWLDGRATYEGGSRARPKDRVTVNQLLKEGLLLLSAQINKSSEMRGARVLKQLGWTKSQSRVGGRTIWWVRP
jgi:hypothetical protein